MKSALTFSLLKNALESLDNFYTDNWEHRRAAMADPGGSWLGRLVERALRRFGYIRFGKVKSRALGYARVIEQHMPEFEQTYAALGDEASRQVMVEQFTYRLLGHERVRLPYPTADYHEQLAKLEATAEAIPDAEVKTLGAAQPLYLFDLESWGLPIRLQARALGVYTIFLAGQYSYQGPDKTVAARDGGTVIDLGGSYGDSALNFANLIGPDGRVFVLEFLPSSLELMQQNLELNPHLRNRIHVLPHAAWKASGVKMYFADRGPATKVQSEPSKDCRDEVETLSVDDLVAQNALKVDFIKMDIEGAELQALQGAEITLRTQRPVLALSVYHRNDDLARIPAFLTSLDLGYQFYLRSSTIFGAELILFAEAG